MRLFKRINAGIFTLILSFLFNSCEGQNTQSIQVKTTIIHKDSICLRAETLPEFRNSVHDTDYQGTGLGLSIVKRLLYLFGSEITLESAIGQGTTFSFSIPFESDLDKTNDLINNIRVDLSTSQIFKVLVVADNRINQLVTKKIMEKNLYKCCVVDDGYEALKILETEIFDIILMDINMPLLNGFETTRLIRNKNITTPIIALTAFDKEEISEEAISAGMNDIIIKPFDQSKLFKAMSTLIYDAKNVG